MLVDLHPNANVQTPVVVSPVLRRRCRSVVCPAVLLALVDRQVSVRLLARLDGRLACADRPCAATCCRCSGVEEAVAVSVSMAARFAVRGGCHRSRSVGFGQRIIRGVLGQHREISARHGYLVVVGRLVRVARVLIEELEKGLVRFGVKMVDLVAAGEEVGDRLGWRLVHDGGGHDVCHVTVVVLAGNVERGIRVESPESSQVDVTTENSYSNRIFQEGISG